MRRLVNPIRAYAWGSRTALARLQGRTVPSPGPEAELWIGAHPRDPSQVEDGPPLTELIAEAPAEVLGEPVLARFGPRLPYLLKLLAAETPLSLQAHPDTDQAAAGYAAEQAAGVPWNAPHRRYVDPYHKPELLVAVRAFRALCGFQEPAESAELLAGVAPLAPVVATLRTGDLRGAVRWLMEHPEPAELVRAAADVSDLGEELAAAYPRDVGVVVALLLNQLTLKPGEAIFMPAGNLHAYLGGVGVEIMAASDNVLRGGLTRKYVDVPELLRVLRFEPLPDPVRRPVRVGPGVETWPAPAAEFALHRIRLAGDVERVALGEPGPRTVVCLAGEVRAGDLRLRPGEAGFAAAAERPLVLSGAGEVYVASVGDFS